MVATLNARLDYFGTTIRIATQLLEQAGPTLHKQFPR